MRNDETKGREVFRPYARLITILGDQLITNKIVAINEIVKNSYDADATNVTVRFINLEFFGKQPTEIPKGKEPCIEIEDDGDGMTIDVIKNVWLKPATPNKLSKKKQKTNARLTKKGRIMQGEKGIGRFAVHKIGEDISLYSKVLGGREAHLRIDFSEYDQDKQLDLFLDQGKEMQYKYLDEVYNYWEENEKPKRIQKKKGTLIQIKNIRETWSVRELEKLERSFQNLITPIIPEDDKKLLKLDIDLVKDFNVGIELDGQEFTRYSSKITFEKIAKQAPFKFVGTIDEEGFLDYSYYGNLGVERSSVESFNLLHNKKDISLKPIEERFFEEDIKTNKLRQIREPNCGIIKFVLYGYDLSDKAKWNTMKDERTFIVNHNVFLYRDGVRVYPYGNPGNDWLELGKRRSEERAGFYFSNNDLIGFVFISHDNNPLLKDATNREGVMDQQGAFEDFRSLLISSVMLMKYESDIDKAKEKVKKQAPIKLIRHDVTKSYSNLVKRLSKADDKETIEAANKYLENSKSYVEEMTRRADIYEDLAGLGMAVEKSSHDSLTILNKMNLNLGDIKKRLVDGSIPKDELLEVISDLEDNTYFLYEQLQIIEPLFRRKKRSESVISVKETTTKVFRYFNYELRNYGIEGAIICKQDIKLELGTGLMLQVLINLMDNAVYWIRTRGDRKHRKISVIIDGSKDELIFADSGPGIEEGAIPYIFLEFFTRKGTSGRGLGLFIVKEILDRIDASIEVITSPKMKIEKGANFKIIFSKG